MHNVKITTIQDGDRTILTVEIDISADVVANSRMSSTGKTKLVASTRGFTDLPGHDLTMLLNVVTLPHKKVK